MTQKMNVCLLNDSFPPMIDGVVNTVVNYATIIQEKYGDVLVATPDFPDAVDNYSFQVCRYRSFDTMKKMGYRTGYPFSAQAVKFVNDFKPEIFHSHCPVMSNLFVRTLRESIDAPLVMTYHSKFDVDIKRVIDSKLLQTAAVKAIVNNISASDEVWVVSRGAGENLRQLGYQGDYRVMHNGVDFPKGRVDDAECAALRKKHGISEDETVFLFVGRMYWYKNQKISIDGLAKTKADGGKFKMIFIGDGGDFEDIKKYAQDAGIGEDCIFTGAIRDRDLLRAYFCISDLFLFPSLYDTNGIVVREAAACSVPSVTIKDSCAAEDIVDMETGLVIDENADAMAAATLWACRNREEAKALGDRALKGLYMSWDDAVGLAYERYGEILDDYKSGKIKRHSVPFDDVFVIMSDVCSAITKTRDFGSGFVEKTKKIITSSEEKLSVRKEQKLERRDVKKKRRESVTKEEK